MCFLLLFFGVFFYSHDVFAEGLLQNLQKRGFRTCGDIVEVPPSKLANGAFFLLTIQSKYRACSN